MSTTRARHIERNYVHEVAAARDQVFPLLCPVREVEWVPGWTCELIHSRSGFAELGCVFAREQPGVGKGVWVVCRYEPAVAIGFVITYPESHVERLNVALADHEGGTRLMWTRSYTALSERGEAMAEELAGPGFEVRMGMLARALDHYCRTGKMLDMDGHRG